MPAEKPEPLSDLRRQRSKLHSASSREGAAITNDRTNCTNHAPEPSTERPAPPIDEYAKSGLTLLRDRFTLGR